MPGPPLRIQDDTDRETTGGNRWKRLQDSARSPRGVCTIALGCTKGLQYLHGLVETLEIHGQDCGKSQYSPSRVLRFKASRIDAHELLRGTSRFANRNYEVPYENAMHANARLTFFPRL